MILPNGLISECRSRAKQNEEQPNSLKFLGITKSERDSEVVGGLNQKKKKGGGGGMFIGVGSRMCIPKTGTKVR